MLKVGGDPKLRDTSSFVLHESQSVAFSIINIDSEIYSRGVSVLGCKRPRVCETVM